MDNVFKMRISFISLLFLFVTNGTLVHSAENSISLTEAIRKLLESGPGVQIENETVKQSESIARRTAGQFDWMLTSGIARDRIHKPLSGGMRNYERNESFSLGIGRQLRNGISVSLSVSSLDLQDDMTNINPVNGSDVSALIIVPLLRGLGSKNTGAEEMAAKSALTATGLLAKHYISEQIFQLTVSYWNYLDALKYLEIQKDTEGYNLRMLRIVESLVSSGELAPVSTEQSKANLIGTRIAISNALLNIQKSKLDMAVLMGYSQAELEKVPLPSDMFPEVMDTVFLQTELQEKFIDESLLKRGDYLASLKNIDTEEIYVHQAENNMKPSLDFNLRVGYAGLDDSPKSGRFLKTFSNNVSGMNSYIGLQLELPIINNNARGLMGYRKSLVRKSQLESLHLSNSAASQVKIAFEAIRRSVYEYQQAKESVESFTSVVNYEVVKAKNGSPDLTSMFDALDRYRGARTAQNEALRKYAVSLAQLRFVTGTVLIEKNLDWMYIPGTMVQLPITD